MKNAIDQLHYKNKEEKCIIYLDKQKSNLATKITKTQNSLSICDNNDLNTPLRPIPQYF
jgi:hypothetical protein